MPAEGHAQPVGEPSPEMRVTGLVTHATLSVLGRNGYQPDCTLGVRLLIGALREFDIPARPVPTMLVVGDQRLTATVTSGEEPSGVVLRVGRGTGVVFADGWDGHLVAVARPREAAMLCDPTFVQVLAQPDVAFVAANHQTLALPLPRPWPTAEDPTLAFSLNGGTVAYRYDPDVDWRPAPGWNHPDRSGLVTQVVTLARQAVAAGVPDGGR